MWTKVKKNAGNPGNPGGGAKSGFRVHRQRTHQRGAILLVPEGKTTGMRATVYSDGNGKLAFSFGDQGDFAVFRPSKSAKSHAVTIPATHNSRIPFGTTDVTLTQDGDMWVLDLNSLPVA